MKTRLSFWLSLSLTMTLAPLGRAGSPPPPVATVPAEETPATGVGAELKQIETTLQELQVSTTNAPAVKAILAEVETTYHQMEVIQQKIRELQGKLRTTMQAEMLKQNPQAKELFARREELTKQMRATSFMSNFLSAPPPPPGR